MIGAKNWLFVGDECAGQRAAVVMSLVQSAKVKAAIEVNGMSPAQEVHLADKAFARQPNLLASIPALPRLEPGQRLLPVAANPYFSQQLTGPYRPDQMCGRGLKPSPRLSRTETCSSDAPGNGEPFPYSRVEKGPQ